MIKGKRILAVVPARSGSKGILNKNLQRIQGVSLIGWAGRVLKQVKGIDAKVISTDSRRYVREAKKWGVDAPFLRPRQLSGDRAGAHETIRHALLASEKYYGLHFDVILIVEPTSPLREPEDLRRTIETLVRSRADSAVTVSPLPNKAHPLKILRLKNGRLNFYEKRGRSVVSRQSLQGGYYWRNGLCYALTRRCVLQTKSIFTAKTVGVVVDRPVANIDEPIDLKWAEFLLKGRIRS